MCVTLFLITSMPKTRS
uniref:Uncharacterized protein n=1 Tax=Medicago truncatula TaxID=3880 RepID=I3SDA9_MEDTR|nr:unknown [Medicago truncatula]